MTSVPALGNRIGLSDIRTAFNGVNPVRMSDYFVDAAARYTAGVAGLPSVGQSISVSQFAGKSRPVGDRITKTVNGATYSLMVAHRAYDYGASSSSLPGPSDLFFRSMFSTGQNTTFTALSQIWSLTNTNNYVNSNLFNLPCTGYLLESYNYDGSQFPVWGSFDTTSHTWASLASAGAVYSSTYLGVSNSRLYASTGTSAPVTVGNTAFLTTSSASSTNTPSDPFTDDSGDYIFMGLSTQGFQAGDGYDTALNNPASGITTICFAMSDGSGVGNRMTSYHRRNSGYRHCTAISNGTPITTGRTSTWHGGADSAGYFLVWARV